jgi:transmembrane sensor
MKKEDFQELVGKYTGGTATPAEQRLLEAYYERLAGPHDPLPGDQEETLRREMLVEILRGAGIEKSRVALMRKSPVWRYAAAAVILLLIGTGGYFRFFYQVHPVNAQSQAARFKNDVKPGGGKAVLTLANGSKIVLDSAGNGQIAQQGGVGVEHLGSGGLAYRVQTTKPTAVLYNTLETPRGGIYQLRLPDGTKVWLNSGSSIRYPVFFAGNLREVELRGEAYFEVAKNASAPFKVKINRKAEVEVLGTEFDVDAYENEPSIKTTLLEGSVRMAEALSAPLVGVNTSKEKPSVVLKPGQQAQLIARENAGNGGVQLKINNDVDLEEVTAWKNGLFRFNGESIETIMQNAARWYDVDVVYKTDNKLSFVATISRDVPISKLLKLLELTDRVHFQIDGKKITVLP